MARITISQYNVLADYLSLLTEAKYVSKVFLTKRIKGKGSIYQYIDIYILIPTPEFRLHLRQSIFSILGPNNINTVEVSPSILRINIGDLIRTKDWVTVSLTKPTNKCTRYLVFYQGVYRIIHHSIPFSRIPNKDLEYTLKSYITFMKVFMGCDSYKLIKHGDLRGKQVFI